MKLAKPLLFTALLCAILFLNACTPAPSACTEEAKVCPDGSTVGREGPTCEFAACPGEGADQALTPAVDTMICGADDTQAHEFAEQFGYTCVETCPSDMDEFAGQLGRFCIKAYNQASLQALPACSTANDCSGESVCGYALHDTQGQELTWSGEKDEMGFGKEGFRCLPADYQNYLINFAGLTTVDENGQVSTAIA